MPPSPAYAPATTHADLGDDFFDVVEAARFPTHVIRWRNRRWDRRVGLDTLTDAEWIEHFGKFVPLPGSFEQPLALRYHGHQFRSYNPDLGDGRGFLFAQLRDIQDGRLLDLGTKGSGRTPYHRGADGRLTLKGGLREVLATEMLEAGGVNTSKSFSLIETGEALHRHDEPSPTRASVLVRLSHSHIRIGTFQRLAFRKDVEGIRRLVAHSVRHYITEAAREDEAAQVVAFYEAVVRRVARMGAGWMAAGFVHGVLNTDNINITGESFDYGPWRWAPTYDPEFTAAYFDHGGLYSLARQPEALMWNLARLGGCLLPVSEEEALQEALSAFEPELHAEFARKVLWRLGLAARDPESDAAVVRAWYDFLVKAQAPLDQAFFDWRGGEAGADRAARGPEAARYAGEEFAAVRAAWRDHAPSAGVNLDHPYFEGRDRPCSMLIDEVEAIWAPIAERDDWTRFEAKIAEIAMMGDVNNANKAAWFG